MSLCSSRRFLAVVVARLHVGLDASLCNVRNVAEVCSRGRRCRRRLRRQLYLDENRCIPRVTVLSAGPLA